MHLYFQKTKFIFDEINALSHPSVAIVILNYNGRNYLEKFLPFVIASTYPDKKIVVADNASTDDSLHLLRTKFPSVELIVLDKNYGFTSGYNKALQQVKADYYVLLNSDVEVSENWLEPIINLMEADKRVAACQPKMLDYKNRNCFEYAGAAGGWIDYLGYPFARGRVFDDLEEDHGQYDKTTNIFWASGAAMFIRAELFHKVGGFDDFFFAHMEEVDLCWRLQRAGYKIKACPASVVYHVGGGTLPKGYRKTYLNFRNNLMMLSKNLPLSEKMWKLPLRLFLDEVFATKALFIGDIASFKAVIQAHGAILKRHIKRKDSSHLPRKPMKSLKGVAAHSIIYSYFIKNKKSFREIIKPDE